MAELYYLALMRSKLRATGPTVPVDQRTTLGWLLQEICGKITNNASLYYTKYIFSEKSFEIRIIYITLY